jgi:hypothetical protein
VSTTCVTFEVGGTYLAVTAFISHTVPRMDKPRCDLGSRADGDRHADADAVGPWFIDASAAT